MVDTRKGTELAREFGVSKALISAIRLGFRGKGAKEKRRQAGVVRAEHRP